MSQLDNYLLFQPVRDDSKTKLQDNLEMVSLNRGRLIEIFPDTDENFWQDENILIRHPQLHPKFEKKLIQADRLYETLREESELEFLETVFGLGAESITLTSSSASSENSSNKFDATGNLLAFSSKIEVIKEKNNEKGYQKTYKIKVKPNPPNIISEEFNQIFDNLVYNKQNKSLQLLYNLVKKGQSVKNFDLEFSHYISRIYKFESKIRASYLALFSIELNFEEQHKQSEVQKTYFSAKF